MTEYTARLNLDDDEVILYGPYSGLQRLIDELNGATAERLGELLDCRGGRLYSMVEACESVAAEGAEVIELCEAMEKHDFDAGPLVSGLWEVSRT